MVICNYFLNGSCRFGGKCLNDHIDLKNLISQEVDAARQGNQFLLSTFGPFKEKSSLPNFIEDVSFEELRYNFQEAQKMGNIQNFAMQVHQQLNDANNKMQSLKTMTPDMVNIITGIYNTESNSDGIQQQTIAPKNVFGSGFGASPAPASSIFGNSTASTFASPSTNIFSNAGSTFGTAQPVAPGNIFGTPAVATNSGNSIFGGSNFPATTTSIFGNSTQQSSFGSFAQPPAQNQAPVQSIFGTPAPTNSIFGNNNTSASNNTGFGGTGDSLFGGQPVQQANIFAQAVTQQNSSNNIFGSNAFSTPHSVFGQSSFPQTVPQQQGGFMTQQAQPTTTNIFNQNVFGVPHLQPPQQTSVFAQNFETNSMQAQDQSPFANSPFAIQTSMPQNQNSSSVFSIQQPQAQVNMNNYSRLHELSNEDLEAFKAERFAFGKIPIIAPCREFCF